MRFAFFSLLAASLALPVIPSSPPSQALSPIQELLLQEDTPISAIDSAASANSKSKSLPIKQTSAIPINGFDLASSADRQRKVIERLDRLDQRRRSQLSADLATLESQKAMSSLKPSTSPPIPIPFKKPFLASESKVPVPKYLENIPKLDLGNLRHQIDPQLTAYKNAPKAPRGQDLELSFDDLFHFEHASSGSPSSASSFTEALEKAIPSLGRSLK